MSNEILLTIVSGSIAAISAAIGGFFAVKASAKQNKKQLFLEVYSRVFSLYVEYVIKSADDKSLYPPYNLLSAIESARLLCGSDSEKILSDLESALLQKDIAASHCGELINALRLSARKDVIKA